MYHSFKEMPVWLNSMELGVLIFDLTKNLPRSEDYGLTSQIRRAALSISSNIAEAFGRKTGLDKNKFYTIAKGSALEVQSQLIYGVKVGYFLPERADELDKQLENLIHELNKIIKTIGNK